MAKLLASWGVVMVYHEEDVGGGRKQQNRERTEPKISRVTPPNPTIKQYAELAVSLACSGVAAPRIRAVAAHDVAE